MWVIFLSGFQLRSLGTKTTPGKLRAVVVAWSTNKNNLREVSWKKKLFKNDLFFRNAVNVLQSEIERQVFFVLPILSRCCRNAFRSSRAKNVVLVGRRRSWKIRKHEARMTQKRSETTTDIMSIVIIASNRVISLRTLATNKQMKTG